MPKRNPQESSRNLERSRGKGEAMDTWALKREAQIPKWQDRIQACRGSGQPVEQWCRDNGISSKTYYRWEKYCLQIAAGTLKPSTPLYPRRTGHSLVKVNPQNLPLLPSAKTTSIQSTAPAELVIHCGCVSMDISPEMPVARIAELVTALNSHV